MKFSFFTKTGKLIEHIVINRAINSDAKRPDCKGTMVQEGESKLYLIGAYIDQTHPETKEFYQSTAVRLMNENEIPSGRRTCYMSVFRCQECGQRRVHVLDFLRVRENDIIKGGAEFRYDEMGEFFENS